MGNSDLLGAMGILDADSNRSSSEARRTIGQKACRIGFTAMEPSWKHADVFPVIARVIEAAYREHQRFVSAREIATRLLQDPEGRHMVEAAREQQQEQQSFEWLASNMVSWFSQRITVGESDWARAFERTKIDGLWAYKPRAATNP